MSRKGKHTSFADLVRDVESSPRTAMQPRPGFYGDVIVDTDGCVFELARADITADQAHDAARGGARVMWDGCGCGGGCGVRRHTLHEVKDMVRSGSPSIRTTKKHEGRISEYRAADGVTLLLAEISVTWGDVLG